MPRLLFISNLFPTMAEPYRGLDNATLLRALTPEFEIRALSPRPALPWARPRFSPRVEDARFRPAWIRAAYVPKIGSRVNHLLMAASLRDEFERMLREFRPDVLLSSWIFPDVLAALHLAHDRVPLVAIAQGSDIHQYLRMPPRRRAILKYLPQAAAVVTRSGELSRLLAAAGFPADKLHTVYNGVDLDRFQPRDRAQARQSAGLPANGAVILFVGNFYPVKNPLLLVQALAGMRTESVLVMAGAGPLEGDARGLAAKIGLGSRVIFAGRKSPAEIAQLMNAADLLAIPSENEGVPNVLLEALASGLPVVASRVGGIPEILSNESLGSLVTPGDSAAFASAMDRGLAERCDPAPIRRAASCFSWENAAGAYRQLLLAAIR
jgi:glycosyltransferase involved in cell wall biosynthesis